MIQSMCICLDRIRIHHLTLLMRYPAQVADQSENLLPPLLKYTGFFSLDQLTSFWLLLYLKTKREKRRKENKYLICWIMSDRIRVCMLTLVPAVEVWLQYFLNLLRESPPQTAPWWVGSTLTTLKDGQQLLQRTNTWHQHKKGTEPHTQRMSVEYVCVCVYLYCISSRVLCSHVVSVSQKRSGQLSQNLVGKVGIIHPTLCKEKQIFNSQSNKCMFALFACTPLVLSSLPRRCCGHHVFVCATGPDVRGPRPPAPPDTPHRGAEPPGMNPGSPSAALTPGWRWPAPPPHSHTPVAAATPAHPKSSIYGNGSKIANKKLVLSEVVVIKCVYLLAVHHVSEAGQCMNPDVNVFMLHGPHGELQRCGQVTAAGRQLQGIRHCIFNITDDVTNSILHLLHHHRPLVQTDLLVVLQNSVDIFQLRVVWQEVNLMEVVAHFFPVGKSTELDLCCWKSWIV